MAILRTGFVRRPEVQLQAEVSECGLACLAMIATAHGHETDLRTLRQRFGSSSLGVTLARLIKDAREIGFATRPLRLEPQELRCVELPCIVHLDMCHFAVLHKCDRFRFELLDPAVGRRTLRSEEFSRRFTGVALELVPGQEFRKRRKQPGSVSVSRLLGPTPGLYVGLFKVFLLAAAIEVFALVAPFLAQWAVDEAMVGGDTELLTTIVAALLLVGGIQTATEAVRDQAVLHLNATLSIQWFGRVSSRLLHLPLAYFERRSLGGVTTRFDTLAAIQGTVSNGLVEGVLDGIMAAGTLAMMIVYSVPLTAVSVGILALYVGLRLALFRAIRSGNESQFVFGARLQSYLIESIQGIQAIKLFGSEGARITALINKSTQQKNAALRIARYGILFRAANALLFRVETAVVLGLAGMAVIEKNFTLGMFIAFSSFREQFARRVSSLADKVIDFRLLGVQTERLADIMLEPPEDPRTGPTLAFLPDASCELVVDNISFAYGEGAPDTLRGIGFAVREGEHVCIVGPSGCGKTTLMKLMTGLLRPQSGEIRYGGVELRALGRRYRDICATVTQHDVLFAGTIAENICFFSEFPDHELIQRCSELACIHDEIRKMPMGYETLVGDMGSALSGGQKQRVLLARALYKRPRILFLDEATSHLDADRERQILRFLRSMRITRIVIAHRQETIAAADRAIDLPALQKRRPS